MSVSVIKQIVLNSIIVCIRWFISYSLNIVSSSNGDETRLNINEAVIRGELTGLVSSREY